MSDKCGIHNENISGAFPVEPNKTKYGLQIKEIKNNLFSYTQMASAVQVYKSLNKIVNKTLGVEARWFRAVPQQRSKDVIFQEYTLYNVEENPYCINVIIPQGNFPDSKYNYDLMGLEYEVPLEIQIDKEYWEDIVGKGTAPQKKDIVYLVIPNKLYQVETSFLSRGFMEQPTTYKLNLRKYMPESARREPINLQETIDKYTVSEQEVFGAAIQENVENLTNDKQMSAFNSTSRDSYKYLDKKLKLVNTPLNIWGVQVTDAYYDMYTSDFYTAVQYTQGDLIKSTEDRAITTWIQSRSSSAALLDVVSITAVTTLVDCNYIIKIKTGNRTFSMGDTLVISRPGSLNFYAKITNTELAGNGTYGCYIDDAVITHLNSIKSDWTSVKNYKCEIRNPITIIEGYNSNNNGLKVELYANQYIKTQYGTQTYISILPERLYENQWYHVVVNIGNTWGQYNVAIWKIGESNETKLTKMFYDTMNFIPEDVTVEYYNLNKSLSFTTNIRVFKCTIEEEKQSNNALQYLIGDSAQALILDNCDPLFKGQYIAKTR